jgi:protocatechuate 3,4-dioxygenase beta subunit
MYLPLAILAVIVVTTSCQAQPKTETKASSKSSNENAGPVGGPCEDCDIMYVDMPKDIPAVDTSEGWNEPGRRLLVHGTVYRVDGKTPAPDVILYYHQTDNTGYYTQGKDQQGRGRRHGHLRGWIKTDKNGYYALYTIRPAPYPNANIPAHIHFYIKEPQLANEYWVDDIMFDDDPLLTASERARQPNRAGNGVVKLTEQNAVLIAKRDFILGKNIPGYPAE